MSLHLPLDRHYIMGEVKDYTFILIGVMLYAFGVTVFLLPYGLTAGGVAGIASIVYYATGLEVQVTYVFINAALLLVALKVLGIRFCLKTIFGVGCMTLVLWLFQRIIEIPTADGGTELPKLIGDEAFMAAILGSISCGMGLAMCFENHGSTGGTDIIAAIVHKYKPISLGGVIMACDIVIVSSCYFIFHDWYRVVYGFVILFVTSTALDWGIGRHHRSVQFLIFSRNSKGIADAIIKSGHGATMISGEGWYTHTNRPIVMCVTNRRNERDILRLVKNVDPYAFISISDASQVMGDGFDTIKENSDSEKAGKRLLIVASNSRHKLAEVKRIFGDHYDIRSLADIGCYFDIPEKASSIRGNALLKARFVKRYYGFDCVADDTAIEVDALEGLPGIHSRNLGSLTDEQLRLTPEMPNMEEMSETVDREMLDILHSTPQEIRTPADHDDAANVKRLLGMMAGKENRTARMHTVVALVTGNFKDAKEWDSVTFEGALEGSIASEPCMQTEDSFFYDTVFVPKGFDKTYHELGADVRDLISQRAVALNKLKGYIETKKKG